MFGYQVALTFQGSRFYKTLCGGMFTLLLMIFTIGYFTYNLYLSVNNVKFDL